MIFAVDPVKRTNDDTELSEHPNRKRWAICFIRSRRSVPRPRRSGSAKSDLSLRRFTGAAVDLRTAAQNRFYSDNAHRQQSETAEELTLDVFHDVWRKASTYDPANGPSSVG